MTEGDSARDDGLRPRSELEAALDVLAEMDFADRADAWRYPENHGVRLTEVTD